MDKPPDKLLGLIAIYLIVFCAFFPLPKTQAPNKVASTPVSLVIVQDNTLKPTITPIFIGETASLGSLGIEYDIVNLIRIKYPERADLLINLTKCEAGWRHDGLWGDNYTSYGAFMFKRGTFYSYCQGDWKNAENQLDCAVKMIKMGLGHKTVGWYNCWRIENLGQYL